MITKKVKKNPQDELIWSMKNPIFKGEKKSQKKNLVKMGQLTNFVIIDIRLRYFRRKKNIKKKKNHLKGKGKKAR